MSNALAADPQKSTVRLAYLPATVVEIHYRGCGHTLPWVLPGRSPECLMYAEAWAALWCPACVAAGRVPTEKVAAFVNRLKTDLFARPSPAPASAAACARRPPHRKGGRRIPGCSVA